PVSSPDTKIQLQTTVSVYMKYFTLLKYVGLFPFTLAHDSTVVGRDHVASKAHQLLSKGRFSLASLGVLLFVSCHFIFELGQMFRTIVMIDAGGESKAETALGQSAWVLLETLALVIAACFWRKRESICRLLSFWHEVEQEIYEECKQRIVIRNQYYKGQ